MNRGNAEFRQFLKMHRVHPPQPQVNAAVRVFIDGIGVHARLHQKNRSQDGVTHLVKGRGIRHALIVSGLSLGPHPGPSHANGRQCCAGGGVGGQRHL